MSPDLPAAGLAVGFMIGLTGVGSGALMAPLLLLLGIQPAVVVGSDLGFGLLTKLVGGGLHVRQATVDWAWVRRLAVGSVPGVLLGSAVIARLAGAPGTLRVLVGAVLVVSAVAALGLELARRRFPARVARMRDPSPRLVAAIGFAIGVTVGATSVGTGSLVDIALVLFSPLAGARLVGTGIVHAILLSAIASAIHWHLGTLDGSIVGLLLVGSVPGVLLGSWAARRAAPQPLRWGVTTVVLLSGLTTLMKALAP
jgi:uncharacterized protein